jgi:hypothetical protein
MTVSYAIRSTVCASEWWSNEFGWTAKPSRELFTQAERDRLNLPMEGEWVATDPAEEVTPDDDEGFSDEHSHLAEDLGVESSHQLARTGVFITLDQGRHYHLQHTVTREGVITEVYNRHGEAIIASLGHTWDQLGDAVMCQEPAGASSSEEA